MKLADRKMRTAIFALRAECPTMMGMPVRIRRCRIPTKFYGWTTFNARRRYFTITLKTWIRDKYTNRVRRVTHGEMQDTVMHEWAHAMTWTPEHPSLTDHDASWGVNYSKVYAALIED